MNLSHPSFLGATLPPDSNFKRNSTQMLKLLESYSSTGRGPLHSYQVAAVLKTKKLIDDDQESGTDPKPVLIVAPTGSGKSGMIVLLPYILNSGKVLILTPSKVISQQLAIDFGYATDQKCFFEKIGMVTQEDELDALLEQVRMIKSPLEIRERLGNLVIVNAQKFGGRSKLTLSLVYRNQEIIEDVEAFFRKFDTLIVDEAHHYPAKTWSTIVEEFSKPGSGLQKKIVFLTAVPFKKVGKKEVLILGEGEEAKKRVAYQITPDDVIGISTRRCEFQEPKRASNPENVLNDIQRIFWGNSKREDRLKNPQAMILVRLRQKAMELVEYMNANSGDPNFAVAVLGNTPLALGKFTRGEHRVAITCGVAKEGYDNPNVICCVVLRRITTGRILFQQFVGRCTRLHMELGGKKEITDRSVGVVLSYPEYCQRKMWDQMGKLAESHPVEVDDDDA